MKIEISDESFKFIKNLMDEIKNQDNLGTASPYFYVVQSKQEIAVPVGMNGNVKYFDSQNCSTYTLEELKNYWFHEWKEIEEKREWTEEEEDEFEEYIQDNCNKFDVDEINVEENVFFTKKGYDDHMRLNGHNYSHLKRSYSYIKHAFRNPELEGLFKALKDIALVGEENEAVTK